MAQFVGQGPIALPGGGAGGGTSVAYSLTSPNPGAAPKLGQRAFDVDGNQYEFCDAVGTIYGFQLVYIFDDNTASAVGTTANRGRVGIAMAGATSDQGLWVQIYGVGYVQIGMSGVSPSDAANGPTTLSTSAGTIFCLQTSATSPAAIGWSSDASTAATIPVYGMWVASDVSLGDVSGHLASALNYPFGLTSAVSDVTSATSFVGTVIRVHLNYPYMDGQAVGNPIIST